MQKKPTFSAASTSCVVIVSIRSPKFARDMRGTGLSAYLVMAIVLRLTIDILLQFVSFSVDDVMCLTKKQRGSR
jgi:hypothetical protein